MKRKLLSLLVVFASIFALNAQTVEGVWQTIDDESGKPRSEVKIFIKNNKLYGQVTKLYRGPKEEQDPVCTKGSDSRNGKKIIGMLIITGLSKDGSEWEADDAIFDPESGKIYDCKVWLDEDNKDLLQVRGYIWTFFRTQTWKRIK